MAQERDENRRVTFDIRDHLGVIADKKDGWKRELNLVSWNGNEPPKFDIRDWSEDHKKMNRGITLYEYEMDKVYSFYRDYCNAKIVAENRNKRNAAAEAGIRAGAEERARQQSLEEQTVQAAPQYRGSDAAQSGMDHAETDHAETDHVEPDNVELDHAAVESMAAAEQNIAAAAEQSVSGSEIAEPF